MDTNLTENNSKNSTLPWWTWLLPFFIANIGTWLSIGFKTDPGTSLWYLPTALGIVMTYWWGPRVLLGIYLNAVICTPLWNLPWQYAPLYALPETIEVGLSWLLFIKIARGKSWLPDLGNVGKFLLLGSLLPTLIANLYLVGQLHFLGNIDQDSIWNNLQLSVSADLATQFVFAIPSLILFTPKINKNGWINTVEPIPSYAFLPEQRNSRWDIIFILSVLIVLPIFIALFQIQDLRIGYGFLMIFLSIRYGIYIAVIGTSWIGIISILLPFILSGRLGLPTASYTGFLTNNLNILFLCGVTLITGRAISDLFTEVADHKQVENNLREAETKYRTLAEQIPPIIYLTEPDQHIGVSYISPQIETLGFTQEEWIADPELWFRQIHPEDQPIVLACIEQSKQDNKPVKLEYRLRTRSGELIWLLDEIVDILDKNGKTIFRQGFMLDITERKQNEEKINQQLEELRRWHEATLRREMRNLELKDEINQLLTQEGKPPRYPSAIIEKDINF